MAAIHHATVKRAEKHGFVLVEQDGGFVLQSIASPSEFVGAYGEKIVYDSTSEALEDWEAHLKADKKGKGHLEVADFDGEDEEGASGSVVKPRYHAEYSQNPHGPGCGDDLDVNLRDAVYHTPEDEKEPRVNLAELRKIGIHNDLWKGEWERLNPGMQRMNLSNRLRALLRNNIDATVWLGVQGEGRFGVEYSPAKGRKRKAAKAA